jgi:Tfp pilus assembly protein FimT
MRWRSSPGYSFAEILVAMAIVAGVATVAVPSFTKLRDQASLGSMQREVMSALYIARSTAIATNSARSVVITPPRSIKIQNLAKTTTYYTRDLSGYGNGVSIAGDPVTITFDARGLVSPPASFTLTINNSLGQSKTVSVFLTGKAMAG